MRDNLGDPDILRTRLTPCLALDILLFLESYILPPIAVVLILVLRNPGRKKCIIKAYKS